MKLRIFYIYFFYSVGLLGLVTLAFQFISSLGGIGGPEKDQVLFSSDTNCAFRRTSCHDPSFKVVPLLPQV